MTYHEPVLLTEVLAHLQIEKGKKYIDATLGDGGHAIEILKRGGTLLGIDINEESLNRATKRIENADLEKNFKGVIGNFKNIDQIAKENDFEKVHGIIYDLGYSSTQLEEDRLGLSFQSDAFLDMRLDRNLGVTAADLLNALSEKDLAKLIYEFSDERLAKRFAKAIVKYRSLKKIQTAKELAKILADEASPDYERGRIHPATRTFQALRIAVNDEISNLEQSLPRAARLLLPGGRMFIISFNSLEDKKAKLFGLRAQPNIKPLYKKPILPGKEEIGRNIRSRSARLRIFEKC